MGLGDRLSLGYNIAVGDLIVQSDDVEMPGVGLPLSIGRTYNSVSTTKSDFGNGWVMDTGADVNLTFLPSGNVVYTGPSGFIAEFTKSPDGSYTPPSGLDSTLVNNNCGSCIAAYSLHDIQAEVTLNFSTAGQLVTEVDPSGNTLTFDYSGANLVGIDSTQGTQFRHTIVSYGSNGLISSIQDPAGRQYQYSDDSNGNLTRFSDSTMAVTFAYGASNLLTQIGGPLGTTSIAYDSSRRAISITRSGAGGTNYTTTLSAASGNLSVQDSNGHRSTFVADGFGRLTTANTPLGHVWQTSWSADSHVNTETPPAGGQFSMAFEPNGNLDSTVTPDGITTSLRYTDTSCPSSPTSSTDPQGNTTTLQYNQACLPTVVTDPTGHTTTYTYDSDGTLASRTNENGATTSFTYTNGFPTTITYPQGSGLGTATPTYNSANLVATKLDGKGDLGTYSYDGFGRLISAYFYNAGGSLAGTATFTRDNAGDVTSMVDPSGATTYTYNTLGQLTEEQFPGGSTVTYTYDGEGNMLTKTDSGGTILYGYDADNELTSVQDPQGLVTTLSYDANGDESRIATPNRMWSGSNIEAYTYNHSGELTQIKGTHFTTTIDSYTYSYTNPGTGALSALRYSMTDAAGDVRRLWRHRARQSSLERQSPRPTWAPRRRTVCRSGTCARQSLSRDLRPATSRG